jgi:hypothetical protein
VRLLLPADVATSIGRVTSLVVRRFAPPGAILALDDEREILLPDAEVPAQTREGDALTVFIHLDSEDRPVATLREPALTLGQVAFLTVKDLTRFGAFVDWGLTKELLVPLGEQTREVRVGDRHPIGLIVDDTGRLAGTMRVSEMLRAKPSFEVGTWVRGEAWRSDPETGVYVIVERAFVGRVGRDEPHTLARGASARFRVTHVQPDGKIELSLRAAAHEELESDAQKILDVLASSPSTSKIGDHSSPESIRDTFGLSKKAFKRAAGRLLKEGRVDIDGDGFLRRRS